MFIIMYFSFKFNFGNDPTVSAPDKGLCCKPTNIGKNDIMYILNFVCTGFLFSFRRSVPSILSFNLSKSFFEMRMRPKVHWLPQSSFPVVGFQSGCFNTRNHRTTGNRMIRKARNKCISCSSRMPMIRRNFHITEKNYTVFFVLQVKL